MGRDLRAVPGVRLVPRGSGGGVFTTSRKAISSVGRQRSETVSSAKLGSAAPHDVPLGRASGLRGRAEGFLPYMVAVAVLLILKSLLPDYTCDDAFISMKVAVNLAEGRGMVFNPGEAGRISVWISYSKNIN